MAFKNYLTSNSYTNVCNMIYEKALRRCTVMLEVWADDTKTLLLANKGVTVDGSLKHISIASLKNKQKSVPAEVIPEMHYIIDNAEGDFAGYEGQLTKYNPNSKNWDKWVLWPNLVAYIEDEQKYYIFVNQKWNEVPDMTADRRVWDKWLAPEVAMAAGNNPMEQMYKLMKTLPQFKDCENI